MLIRSAYVTSMQRVGDGVGTWIIAVAVGQTTDLPLLREPMHLASDYIHLTRTPGNVTPTAAYGSTSLTTRVTLRL
jgi:hypothetical protein